MQHNRAGRKLRRTTSHRLAMFSNQLDSLMTHERIQTTLTKAKELRPLAEKLITAGQERRRRGAPPGLPVDPGPDHRQEGLRDDRAALRGPAGRLHADPPARRPQGRRAPRRRSSSSSTSSSRPRRRGPRKESLSDRARRASGGRVETVRKEKPEGGEGEEAREAAPRPRKAAGAEGRAGQAGRQARPEEGPVAHRPVEARRLRSSRFRRCHGAPLSSGALRFCG